jgi:zinc metalloprotease ZmpB
MEKVVQEFVRSRNVHLDCDEHGIVRQVLHTHAPIITQAATPQLAAASYLGQFSELLGLPAQQLANLGLAPARDIEDAPIEYRFLKEKRQFDSATVAYYQTALGLPVWEAGLAVQMRLDPFRILSAQCTRHADFKPEAPARAAT